MNKRSRRYIRLLAAAAAAGALSLTSLAATAAPAPSGPEVTPFAITQAQGTQSCGPDQTVRVSATLNARGRVYYARLQSGRWIDVGTTGVYQFGHTHDFGARTVTWKAIASGAGMETVYDSCG